MAQIEMRNGAINNPVIKNETILPYCKIFPIDISLFLNVHLQLSKKKLRKTKFSISKPWTKREMPITRGILPSIFSEEDSPKPRLSDFSDHRRFYGGWGRKIGSWHSRPNTRENSVWYQIKNQNSPKNELDRNTFTNQLNVSKCYLEWLTLSDFDIKNIFGKLSTSSSWF